MIEMIACVAGGACSPRGPATRNISLAREYCHRPNNPANYAGYVCETGNEKD